MNKATRKIKSILIPFGTGKMGDAALALAKLMADEIIIVGVAVVEKGESLSAGAEIARAVRKRFLSIGNQSTSGPSVRAKAKVIVSETPWTDLQKVITAEDPELFLVEWDQDHPCCGISLADLLFSASCNVGIVRANQPFEPERVLAAVRGGPHAELTTRVALSIDAPQLDVLHLSLSGSNDAPFKGLKHILNQLPEVNFRSITTEDYVQSICEESNRYDLTVLGVTARQSRNHASLGPVAEKLMTDTQSNVIVLKTKRDITETVFDESAGVQAISILVDKWFAENTFHADEFADISQLMRLKERAGTTISLALPALNEESSVGKVIDTIKKELMDKYPLLDEIVLIDSNSTDHTREIAETLGVPVYIHQEILPEMGVRAGKGEALWKSLLVTKGDIIAWVDTDIVNINPGFVYGIVGPLLLNSAIHFVKGFYRRPIKVGRKIEKEGGGRVTELTARPLINLFYPELSGIIQPLSGEYAGRRESLEKAVFFSGYGVETGLLIDVFEQKGLQAIAQVNLQERIHKNQSLEALSKMSFAIIQTVLRKLETRYDRAFIEDVNKTMKMIHSGKNGYYLDVEEIAEFERPPMITVKAYQERNKK